MPTQRKDINILLLGPTGAGKSTFINGFYNYAIYQDIDEVLAGNIKYCIPTVFEWYDEQGNSYPIIVGENEDVGEHQLIGKSATQYVKSYLFDFTTVSIRFIDTPGFGDTDGVAKDEKICEHLLQFLSNTKELRELHAILFLFKPNENRITTFFQYCLNQIFSKLHRSACKNIIFLFSHTKGTDYRPGPTLGLLRKAIEGLTGEKIPCDKNNIFCIESDCIKYLLTFFYFDKNLEIDDSIKKSYEIAWNRSSAECVRLIKYVLNLPHPHRIDDTVAINEARNCSVKLQRLLPRISVNIIEKIEECKKHEKSIIDAGADIEKIKEVLHTTTIIKREGKRHVVCHNRNCTLKKSGENKACCLNCKAWAVRLCSELFLKTACLVCKCNGLDHVFIDNKDYAEKVQEKNEEIEENIDEKQSLLNEARLRMLELRIIVKKYEIEKKYIDYCIEKLSDFLDRTSIVSDQRRNENMDSYIGNDSDTVPDIVSQDDFRRILENLKNLELTGNDIKELFGADNIIIPEENKYYIEPISGSWRSVFDVVP